MGRVDDFQRDGAVVVRAAFTPAEVEQVTRGIERNLAEPSPRALVASRDDDPGRFFEDFCNWSRFPELEQVIRESQAAAIAGELTRSSQIRLYHDHVLVKEAATRQPHSLAPGSALLQRRGQPDLQRVDAGRPGAARRRSSSWPAPTWGRG